MGVVKPKWYLTTRETAYILDISTSTVRAYVRRGILTGWTEDNRRMLIQSRELVQKMWKFTRDYTAYRSYMLASDWCEVSKEETHFAESGTVLVVRVHHKCYEYWHNRAEHADVPQTVEDNWLYWCTFIIPMGDNDLAEIQELAKKATS